MLLAAFMFLFPSCAASCTGPATCNERVYVKTMPSNGNSTSLICDAGAEASYEIVKELEEDQRDKVVITCACPDSDEESTPAE